MRGYAEKRDCVFFGLRSETGAPDWMPAPFREKKDLPKAPTDGRNTNDFERAFLKRKKTTKETES